MFAIKIMRTILINRNKTVINLVTTTNKRLTLIETTLKTHVCSKKSCGT